MFKKLAVIYKTNQPQIQVYYGEASLWLSPGWPLFTGLTVLSGVDYPVNGSLYMIFRRDNKKTFIQLLKTLCILQTSIILDFINFR